MGIGISGEKLIESVDPTNLLVYFFKNYLHTLEKEKKFNDVMLHCAGKNRNRAVLSTILYFMKMVTIIQALIYDF